MHRRNGYQLGKRRKRRNAAGICSVMLVFVVIILRYFYGQTGVVAAEEIFPSVEEGSFLADDKKEQMKMKKQYGTEDGMDSENSALEERPNIRREDILVALDAGHGGEDEGSRREDVLEKEINLEISWRTEAKLKKLGYRVLLIRQEDEKLSLAERVQIANDAGANIYVSIHQNACEEKSSEVSGIEVWYNGDKAKTGSERLSKLLYKNLLLHTGAEERTVSEEDSFYVTRETEMPACLVETGFLSNPAERGRLVTQEYQDKIAEGIVSGIDLYFFPKTMYFTFDDGPSAENTDKVLDILKEKNIKATFFLVGENVEKYPKTAKRIVEEGHSIGIHCYSHDYKKIYADTESYLADFEKAQKVVLEVTGVETKLFRFPGGSINAYNKNVQKEIAERMTEKGYVYFDWNASLEDATRDNEPDKLIRNATESTLGRKRVIMLAHDVIGNTVLCLDELLEQFPEYRMLPLTQDVEPIVF